MQIYSLWRPRILPINNERPFKQKQYYLLETPRKSIEIIFHSHKSLLYHYNDPWFKEDTSVEFDVQMGSYGSAKVCKVNALFMLDMLSTLFEKNSTSLYRDDDLSIFKNYNGHQNNTIRKDLMKLFKKHQLNLDIKRNLKLQTIQTHSN